MKKYLLITTLFGLLISLIKVQVFNIKTLTKNESFESELSEKINIVPQNIASDGRCSKAKDLNNYIS